jgi:hypothetical protein
MRFGDIASVNAGLGILKCYLSARNYSSGLVIHRYFQGGQFLGLNSARQQQQQDNDPN